MASARLSWMVPSLWRSSIDVQTPALRCAIAAQRIRAYHPSRRRRQQQEQIPQRYGTANEPPPHLGGGKGIGPSMGKQQAQEAKALPRIGEKLQAVGEEEVKAEAEQKSEPKKRTERQSATTNGQATTTRVTKDPVLDASGAQASQEPPSPPKVGDEAPLDSILSSIPDASQKDSKQTDKQENPFVEAQPDATNAEAVPHKAPHMEPPRYVHHFDTHGLVKRLKDGGWDEKHAITIMKSMRLMLADNTDLAKDALVSKSNLENEAYLFKAACAELRTEVTSRRKTEQEKMRTERTQLQHEVDILSQRLGQESTTLKDELKGMFDDRKMAVRNEQRNTESKVQQLNYAITVQLQADGKSEVEGLRWIMTRRVIMALGLVVLMVVGSLKGYSNHMANVEAARTKPAMTSGGTQTEDFDEGAAARQGLVGAEGLVLKEGNPAFVSLG